MQLRWVAATASIVVAFGSAASATGARGEATDLSAALRAALASSPVDTRRTAALAIDLRTGQTVFEINAGKPLVPASTEKLAVSFAALKVLGPRHRFRTTVAATGFRDGRSWRGDLYLVGGGDPTLANRDLTRLARKVAALGVRRITGRVAGDESLFDTQRAAPGWRPSYVGDESEPISALSVSDAERSGLNGSAAAAARAFREALVRSGITVAGRAVTGRAPVGAVELAEDVSGPLRLVVRLMNRDSDNFTSEMVLKFLGTTAGERGSFSRGADVVRSALEEAGIPVAGVRVVDGSGLSLLDRTTARALVATLRAGLADDEIGEAFTSSLAVAGVSGTLEKRLVRRPTRGRVTAKTGTTRRSSALAGFVRRDYVFAIVQNGSPVPYWPARAAQDRFVTVLARS